MHVLIVIALVEVAIILSIALVAGVMHLSWIVLRLSVRLTFWTVYSLLHLLITEGVYCVQSAKRTGSVSGTDSASVVPTSYYSNRQADSGIEEGETTTPQSVIGYALPVHVRSRKSGNRSRTIPDNATSRMSAPWVVYCKLNRH